MTDLVNQILESFENGDYSSAETDCVEYVNRCKESFMENLTVNTGTDYFASVVLLGQIHQGMKKPWKIFPFLEAAQGCLRFLDDYMQDRNMTCGAMKSAGELYARGGYFPEAVRYYLKAFELSEDQDDREDFVYYLYLYSFRMKGEVLPEYRKTVSEQIDTDREKALYSEAKSTFESLFATDPLESEECYLEVRYQVESEVDQILSREMNRDGLPDCIRYWRIKKQVLADCFHIDWKSPEECNPQISFCDTKEHA